MEPILPGATIGVLGSGQLGRMFTIAARRMGYRVHVYSPETDTPTGQVADLEITAAYDDYDQLARFSRDVSVVTFEFENVPLATVEAVQTVVPVRPSGHVLHTTQHRLREKTFLEEAGFPVTPFYAIRTEDDLQGVPETALPGILKTAAWGYDGKGQVKVESAGALAEAWRGMQQEAILEELVDFDCELSVVAVRSSDGTTVCFPPVENLHIRHILDVTLSPARIPEETSEQAESLAKSILSELDIVGVLCVEMFLTRERTLLVNELAPRPHNSGHVTIDAHLACQFEQQLRAVCDLPLASTQQLRPAAMVNLLGDLWTNGTPNWRAVLAIPEVKLHLYGKREPKAGRKMGHLTATAPTLHEARRIVLEARELLETRPAT